VIRPRLATRLALAAAFGACAGRGPAPGDAEIPAACAVLAVPAGAAGPAAPAPAHVLAALGTDPASGSWEELAQAFWPRWRVFRIVDPTHRSRLRSAAIDARGEVVPLTRTRALARASPTLACFNALSRSEGVRIERGEVEAYLAFFLRTHLAETGQFLRGEADAAAVVAHRWQGRHDEWMLARLEAVVDPVFDVGRTPRGFAATAYDWHWSRGVVHRYDIAVGRDGEVALRDSPYGAQPPREGPLATASCFAVHPDGLVLTAHHAVAEAAAITLRFASGDELAATVERSAPERDLALLRVDRELPAALALAERETEPGEPVFTLAHPGPRLLWSEPELAAGRVRGPGPRAFLVETDVPARAGSSGAPLVDASGRVLGMLSRITAQGDAWRTTLVVRAAELRALLGATPEAPPAAASREEALARVRAAICEVEVELVDSPRPPDPDAS